MRVYAWRQRAHINIGNHGWWRWITRGEWLS